ncbi:MAG: hypothetical protein COA87_006970 [Halomonas sp.]|nr:hypothetical protein [Halomonas sp.]MBL1267480.1 hypothetical protein [Halomonas sp.]
MKLATALALSCSVGVLALPTTVSAYFDEPGTWSSGWGQGISEYSAVSTDGKARLYIACSPDRAVSMDLTVGDNTYGIDSQGDFNLIIDGEEVSTPYETDSHVGADWFLYSWEALRKANSIVAVTSDGQSVALPSKGSAAALPNASSPEMSCLTGFYSF